MKRSFVLLLSLAVVFPSGTAGSQAATRHNGRILTSQVGSEIGTFKPDGSDYRKLVEADSGIGAWSPDKSLVAYVRLGPDWENLYVIAADGSDERLLAEGVQEFSWSPDGDHLAYIDGSGGLVENCAAIWIVDVHTSAKQMVAEAPGCTAAEPAWSPSGDEIAFVNGHDSGDMNLELDIFSVHVNTGEIAQLTDAPGIDRDPDWSPNGDFIAFESSRDHDQDHKGAGGCFRRTEIYRMRSDGSRQKRLTGNLGNPECDPSWSPDGRKIVWTTFLQKRSGDGRSPKIRIADRDGSRFVRITNARREPSFQGDFSPNGRRIVFTIFAPEGSDWYFDLYKARLDGTGRVRLTKGGVRAGRPDW